MKAKSEVDGQPQRPLPALLDQVKVLTLTELHSRLAEEGFSAIQPRHGVVFRFIDDAGARLTDLAERSGVTKQSVGEAVAELEQLGFVERAADAVDRRVKIIRLTRRGRAARAASERILAEIETRRAHLVGAENLAALRHTLERIIAAEHG
ncbi:MarR family winged helix-turn-helix transcriptional regulator [Nocardia blacklockiae]|uniref:MarR family winged helix-turn-helix transcriptional regulator n=1 Tax=Nocardia blacklockiae TaxID=480036 RepID=UPI001895D28B|nr:MarR family transcriptional regulator [Nocardia blacklockiae]MBF6174186.1 MarR family transcriptional regulator [Nocardia blacklockiae]